MEVSAVCEELWSLVQCGPLWTKHYNFCQARLLLFSTQSSKFNSQWLNSKRSRADVIIQMHHPPPTTHPQLLKAVRVIVFTLFQLTNQMEDISMTFWMTFQMIFQIIKWLLKWANDFSKWLFQMTWNQQPIWYQK